MNRYYIVLFVIALSSASCLNEKLKQAQEQMSWKTMDSVFQIINPKPGKEKFTKGDSVSVAIVTVLNRDGVTLVDTGYMNKDCLRFAELVTLIMLQENENGLVKKSEEALLRADFSALDWRKDFVVTVFLKKDARQNEVDTLVKKIRRLPQVHRAEYISKEEAKKRWLARGETDFTESLDENPLPASVELQIEPDYLSEPAMKEFADELQQKFPDQIFSTAYQDKLMKVIDCSRKFIFLLNYKT